MKQPSDEPVQEGWLNDESVVEQRSLVRNQLASMSIGLAPQHFVAGARAIGFIKSKTFQSPVRLLDVGCASGYYSEIFEFFHPSEVLYCGADLNPAMIRAAQEFYPDLNFYVWDLCRPWEGESFHAVFSGATLMHIREWKIALGHLADAAQDWLVLHRTWLKTDGSQTSISTGDAYGHCAWYITFELAEIEMILAHHDFSLETQIDCGEGGGEDWTIQTLVFQRH